MKLKHHVNFAVTTNYGRSEMGAYALRVEPREDQTDECHDRSVSELAGLEEGPRTPKHCGHTKEVWALYAG